MNHIAEQIKSHISLNEENDIDIFDDHESLCHYGMPRRSGRYPWGSGEEPYQHS